MRVALNLEQLFHDPPGGIGRYVASLARLLPGSLVGGAPIELVPCVARHPVGEVAAVLQEAGLGRLDPVVARLPRPALYQAWNVLGWPRLSSESPRLARVDVVHAPSVAVPPRPRGAALVVTVHDAAPLLYPATFTRRGRFFHRRGLAAAAARADLVITVSHAAADEIARLSAIPRERLRVVHHGLDLVAATEDDEQRARERVGVGSRPYVLWAGTLEPRKNVATLVAGFAAALGQDPGLEHALVLVGPQGWLGEAEAVGRSAAALGERVVLAGPVPGATLRGLYRGAVAFAFPSSHEGFGLPVLEALAQGTPVLAADIPPLREVAGDAATFVDPADPSAWATALLRMLRGPADRRGAQTTVARLRAAQFTQERFVAATLAVYREAVAIAADR